ncbi:hypothetical protein TcCL_Unassigned05356 [Trypanosoma cruzi]|nr:hypothetical protein TcCL_Unassigned05356 [Trypanosoma cruzi]
MVLVVMRVGFLLLLELLALMVVGFPSVLLRLRLSDFHPAHLHFVQLRVVLLHHFPLLHPNFYFQPFLLPLLLPKILLGVRDVLPEICVAAPLLTIVFVSLVPAPHFLFFPAQLQYHL